MTKNYLGLILLAVFSISCSSVHQYSGAPHETATIQPEKINFFQAKVTLKSINNKVVTNIVKNNFTPRSIKTGMTSVAVSRNKGNGYISKGTLHFNAEPGRTYILSHNNSENLIFTATEQATGRIVATAQETREIRPKVILMPQMLF